MIAGRRTGSTTSQKFAAKFWFRAYDRHNVQNTTTEQTETKSFLLKKHALFAKKSSAAMQRQISLCQPTPQKKKKNETHEPECWHACWGRKATHTDIVVGHRDMTHSFDTLVGHSCLTLLCNILVNHSYSTLLWDTLAWHVFSTLLRGTFTCDTLTWHVFFTLL